MKVLRKLIEKILCRNVDAISFKDAMDLADLPVITLYQGDRKFHFLLDTGSNNSIIDKNILSKINHKDINVQSKLYGLEGNIQKVSMCSIELFYKTKCYTYNYLVSDMKAPFDAIKKDTGVQLHGILGAKFFNDFKYVLDFDELIAYSKE